MALGRLYLSGERTGHTHTHTHTHAHTHITASKTHRSTLEMSGGTYDTGNLCSQPVGDMSLHLPVLQPKRWPDSWENIQVDGELKRIHFFPSCFGENNKILQNIHFLRRSKSKHPPTRAHIRLQTHSLWKDPISWREKNESLKGQRKIIPLKKIYHRHKNNFQTTSALCALHLIKMWTLRKESGKTRREEWNEKAAGWEVGGNQKQTI